MKEEEKAIKCLVSRDGQAMEEFISLKGNFDEDGSVNLGRDSSDKKSWMSSAQLWSSNVVDYDSQKQQNSFSELKQVKFRSCFFWFLFYFILYILSFLTSGIL